MPAHSHYAVALSPDLNVLPADFAAAWNADADCRTAGEAGLRAGATKSFDPLLETIVIGFAINIASAVVYDLVKRAVSNAVARAKARRGGAPSPAPADMDVTAIQQPDGTMVLVVQLKPNPNPPKP